MRRAPVLSFVGISIAALAAVPLRGARPAPGDPQQTAAPQTVRPLDADVTPLTSENIAGHRLWIIVLDKGRMQAEDMRRADADALKWMREKTPNVDVVAIAEISSDGVQMLQDFTTNDGKLQRALAAFGGQPVDMAAQRLPSAASDLEALDNDVRLTALKTICDGLRPWPEKKEMLYFTAGLSGGGGDNSEQYRDAIASCERSHVTIDSIDAHGLTVSGRGSAATVRADPTGSSGRPAPSNSLTPRPDVPATGRPEFSGTWRCEHCPDDLMKSKTALWLGPQFKIESTASAMSFQASGSHALNWTFDVGGAATINTAVPTAAGGWASTLSWTGDGLELRMSGTIQKDGVAVPIVVTHVLSRIADKGGKNGNLEVTTTVAPSGVIPDGVVVYKKVG